MFEMGSQMAEYGNGGPPRGGWAGEEEYGGYPQGEEEYGYGRRARRNTATRRARRSGRQGEEEYGYGQGEEEYGYGAGRGGVRGRGRGGAVPAGAGGADPGRRAGARRAARRRQEEAPVPSSVATARARPSGEGEAGEAEEQFLHKLLLGALGKEAEFNEAPLTPAQEAEFTERLLETADEAELARVIGGIVNTVGRAVQGVQGAVNSPQGRAIIDAVAPVAEAALEGEAAGEVLEIESGEIDQEAGQYEAAQRVVQLASAAARDVATAPPGAPPQVVGELSVIRAARHFARPLFRSALRAVSPFARRALGIRATTCTGAGPAAGRGGGYRGGGYRGGYRPGYRYGRPYYGRRYGYGTRRYGPRYRLRIPGVLRARPWAPLPRPSPRPGRRPSRRCRRSRATAGSRCRSGRRLRHRSLRPAAAAPSRRGSAPPARARPAPRGAAERVRLGWRRRRRRRRRRAYGGYRGGGGGGYRPPEEDDQEFGVGGPW